MALTNGDVPLVEQNATKYILVSGGVISGIGKGVITSSLGTLLKSMGLHVTAIKIDPYLNIDAGTFSPYEHGESCSRRAWVCPYTYHSLAFLVTCV